MKCGMTRPEDVQPFAQRIYNETQRLIRLVEDIINLSHLDEDGSYEWKELDLYDSAREVVDSLTDVAAEKQVKLTLDGSPVSIRGVGELVRGLIYNLCDNAIKYNRPNGTVMVSVTREEGCPVLTVADNGIGIPEEEQDRVFERFYRVDKSRSKEVGGTGLGLSIVKHSAQVLGAKISLDSRLGEGTTIRIHFPQ